MKIDTLVDAHSMVEQLRFDLEQFYNNKAHTGLADIEILTAISFLRLAKHALEKADLIQARAVADMQLGK